MNRNNKIDNLRAVSILLVVFGHSIIIYSNSWNIYMTSRVVTILDFIKSIINLIQMPVFIFISGYLFSIKTFSNINVNRGGKIFLLNKIRRLLIPWLLIGLFWMIPIRLFIAYPPYKGESIFSIILKFISGNDCGHLWFLPTLFILFCAFQSVSFLLENFYINRSAFIFMILVFLNLLSGKFLFIPYISYVFQYAIFFYFGILLRYYDNSIMSTTKKYWIRFILLVITFLLSGVALRYNRVSVFASLFWIITLYLFVTKRKINILYDISKNSFGIYLFHSPLVYISFAMWPNINPGLMILINFVCFGICSYVLTIILRKLKLNFIIGEN